MTTVGIIQPTFQRIEEANRPKNNENKIIFKKLENEKVIALIKELLYNSMAQAIIKIFQTSHLVLKIFLFVFVIGTSGLCAFLVVQSILSYLSYDVSTTTRTLYEIPAIFPKITICNINPFITEEAFLFLKECNRQFMPQIDLFNPKEIETLSYLNKSHLFRTLNAFALAKIQTLNYTNQNQRLLGHNLSDILIDCSFNQQLCRNDFNWIFDSNRGNCYSFNSGYNYENDKIILKKSYIGGSLMGLQLKMYSNFNQKLSMFNSFTGGDGMIIRIENSSYSVNSFSNEIFIPSGMLTSISLQRTFKSYLPKPYSNCDLDNDSPSSFDSELYQLIYHSQYDYNQELCVVQCFQKKAIETCNCTYLDLLSLFKNETCTTPKSVSCIGQVLETFISNNLIDSCKSSCPLECNRTIYTYSISSINLIGDSFLDLINSSKNLLPDFSDNTLDKSKAKSSFIHLYLFYDSLSYTINTESPQMSIIALLANIGGTLGLFMGVSVFSLCEIIELLIEIYYLKTG